MIRVLLLLAPLAIAACADEPTVPPPAAPVVGPTAARPPTGAAVPSPAIGANIASAARVVESLRHGFTACYNRGLAADRTMQGRIMLTVRVAPDGTVARVTTSGLEGLSSEVIDCLVIRLVPAQFDAQGPKGATLQIPITFIQKRK